MSLVKYFLHQMYCILTILGKIIDLYKLWQKLKNIMEAIKLIEE